MEKIDKAFRALLTILLLINLFVTYYAVRAGWEIYMTKKEYDHLLQIPYFTSESGELANGFYQVNNMYYCVLTANRTAEEIASIEAHEVCHALIYNDRAHFCNLSGYFNSSK